MQRYARHWQRILAMVFKEVRQAARDPGTMAMMFAMPLMQLLIFGYAINTDPRHLPLAIESNDNSAYSRSIAAALGNTSYFEVRHIVAGKGDGERLLASGEVQFVVSIPPDFSRDLVRGRKPQLLVVADASDPSASGPALNAIGEAIQSALKHDLIGSQAPKGTAAPPVEVVVQRNYNPEGITSYNTVPGLLAIILTMTMVMQTAMTVTREVEQGTMENLLATPLRPFEVMIGKIVPNLVIGTVQMIIVLIFAALIFKVPFAGSVWLLIAVSMLFMAVNLAVGFTFSTISSSQVQAMQLSFFFMMPSILLSGFAFPYRGMPRAIQIASEVLPATHYLRLVRGIMLKGWDTSLAVQPSLVLLAMLFVLGFIAVRRYQDTIA
ncbi:MAG: ABC transporter permease [Novosphingobium sp.]